jgi:hypothetical protein
MTNLPDVRGEENRCLGDVRAVLLVALLLLVVYLFPASLHMDGGDSETICQKGHSCAAKVKSILPAVGTNCHDGPVLLARLRLSRRIRLALWEGEQSPCVKRCALAVAPSPGAVAMDPSNRAGWRLCRGGA